LWVETTDLRVANDKMSAALEFILPRTFVGEICLYDMHLRVKAAQSRGVRRVLIKGNNLVEPVSLEERKKILAHKASGSCNYDLLCGAFFTG
jgi:hypothetical protein